MCLLVVINTWSGIAGGIVCCVDFGGIVCCVDFGWECAHVLLLLLWWWILWGLFICVCVCLLLVVCKYRYKGG